MPLAHHRTSDALTVRAHDRDPFEPAQPESEPDPTHEPNPAPWHDPGPDVREIDLPPNSPTRGIPVDNPELPRREPDR
jgi:hypothetical protein